MHYSYTPSGVCSRNIEFDLEDGIVKNISFFGGCDGNLKAISILSEGKPATELAEMLQGTTCGFKPTSCSDQLAKALLEALAKAE